MKYELDKETGALILDRVLYTSTIYPANYGFIPRTFADDSDPLDILVLCSERILPMAIVRCYPIGAIIMTDDKANDEKIISLPFNDPRYNCYNDISELPQHVFEEMTHFFTIYKRLEHTETAVSKVVGRAEALLIVERAMERYSIQFGKYGY
jgi:inorganic pyrophosphatase